MVNSKAFCANGHMLSGPYDADGNVPENSLLSMRREICSTCGSIKGPGWTIRKVEWVPEKSWWNPFGWITGRWEEVVVQEDSMEVIAPPSNTLQPCCKPDLPAVK